VGFEELFADERADGYLHEGRLYWADSYFCPARECQCDQVRIAFCEDEARRDIAVDLVLLRVADTSVEVVELMPEDGAPEVLVRALVERLQRRHRVGEYLARRRARMKSVDPKRLEKRSAPVRAEVVPSRNDPCPYGSGKRYKKHCLGKATTR
jgi:hypothetical protein